MQLRRFSSVLTELHDRRQAPAAFVYAFLIFVATLSSHRIGAFYFDAAFYWDLGDPADFKADTITARGYVFPVILYLIRLLADRMADPVLAYGVLASLIYAFVVTVLLPRWFVEIFGGRATFLRRLVPAGLLAVFFPGLLFYPLTDLPAFVLALGGLYCVYRAAAMVDGRAWPVFAHVLLAGGLAYAAYNTRTIYMFAIPAVLLLVLVAFRRRRATLLAAALGGMALVGLPQAVFNGNAGTGYSPAVSFPVGKNSLFVAQLLAGVTVQRYETSRHSGGLAYLDPAGIRIIERVRDRLPVYTFPEYLNGTSDPNRVVRFADYFSMVAEFPLDFVGIYTRHVVSGLDARDGEVYLERSTAGRQRRSLYNFCLLAAACLTLLGPAAGAAQRAASPAGRPARYWPLGLAVMLLPVAAIIPGAIETRFFLPLHLLAYCVLAFHASPAALLATLRARPHLIAVALALGALYFAVALAGFANG